MAWLTFMARNPLVVAGLVIVAFLALLFGAGGIVGFMASGGVARMFTGLIALAYFLVVVVVTRFVVLTISSDLQDAINQNPLARAVLSVGLYLSGALLTLAIFG